MRIGQQALISMLKSNLIELKFKRRAEKKGWNTFRRMLCTNDMGVLNTAAGMLALNYRKPTNPPAYPWWQYNLVCVYDLFWQKFRMVSCDDVDVITVINTTDPNKFWKYFNVYLKMMSAQDKINFMNK